MSALDAAKEIEESALTPVTGGGGRGRLIARRFARNRLALFGLIIIVVLFLAAYIGPYLTQWQLTDIDFDNFQTGPSSTHWFGTTQTGQDMFVLTMRGAQKSLVIGLIGGPLTTAIAALIGSVAGYLGGWVDRLLVWFIDVMLVMPSFLLLAILSPTFKGKTWLLFVVLLAAFAWMITARIVRSLTLSLKSREFVLAAKYMGVSTPRIILRHILPNMASLLIIDATISVAVTILGESGLSYFGFGIQPPDVSLGTLISIGQGSVNTYPWLFLFPAGILILIILAVNFIGDGLRDALDPNASGAKSKAKRKEQTDDEALPGETTVVEIAQ
ncbi:ABC transporter permease [Actinocrinis sp.]|uniref:ABC transporter permease n=1 Tax=Actinocrinis sp. TaxID=1920516 RepID=UPI002D43FE9C|nr:ABC transporter permease [Actinocrinis sp.]HZP53318.1 ABC transporter permease [Actinocrinis sp.]